MIQRRSVLQALSAVGIPFGVLDVQAQDRQLKVIVPYGPGGITDTIARILLDALKTHVPHRTAIVDNRPGGGGIIGVRSLSLTPPDGNTVILQNLSNFIAQTYLLKEANYDPLNGFTPVASIGATPGFLYAHAGLGATTLPEFITYARKHPGEVHFATAGLNTADWLKLMQMSSLADIKVTAVPYKATPDMMVALMRGEVQALLTSPSTALNDQVAHGTVKALGVASLQRISLDPKLPTIAEHIPGFSSEDWWSFYAPRGTHLDALADVLTGFRAAIGDPEVKTKLEGFFVETRWRDARQLADQARKVSAEMKQLTTDLKVIAA